MNNFLPKGTTITCPRKGHVIATVARDIMPRGLISTRDVDFQPGQSKVMGELPSCSIEGCGSKYLTQGSLHTENGWWPKDPILEKTTR